MIARVRAAVGAAATLALAVALAGCFAQPASVLDQHGWTDHEFVSQERVLVGVFESRTWNRYLSASREIGLDFEAWWGRDAHVTTYDVGPASAQVLVGGDAPIGAWLVAEDGRVLPLNSDELPRP